MVRGEGVGRDGWEGVGGCGGVCVRESEWVGRVSV